MRNDFCTGYLAHSAKGKEWQNHKYVAKVKLASGKYFYFYSQAEYDRFLKRVKKQGDSEREKINEKLGKNKPVEKKKATTDSTSKKKKGSGSSKKSSGSKKGKTSTGSSKKSSTKKEATEKKSSAAKTAKEKTTKEKTTKASTKAVQTTTQEVGVKKTTPTLSAYKYQYDLQDKDIDTYKGTENDSDRVTANRVKEIIEDMIDKYPDNASGYLISSFSDNISYQFQWVKENGTIKLVDPDSGIEVSADAGLINSTQVNLFRTDNKKKKS